MRTDDNGNVRRERERNRTATRNFLHALADTSLWPSWFSFDVVASRSMILRRSSRLMTSKASFASSATTSLSWF